MTLYQVDCWNCNEGFVEAEDEWDDELVCDICEGKGFLIVSELTEDNCDNAIPVAALRQKEG